MIRWFAGVLALFLMASSAAAQRFDDRRGGTPGDFDFYVLALSWSPTFCAGEAGRRSRQQCEIEARDEFVVHGLWPQFERGFPSYCGAGQRFLPRPVLSKAAEIFPDERLARYQWEKHGSCSGLGPSQYFDDVAAARAKVTIPAEFHRPKQPIETSPQDIERGFVAANRGLRPDMMAVSCQRGRLTEVRVCLSRDLRSFVPCPEVNRSACRSRDLTVPVGRER
ncbi:MAG TPA: ribonuclease T2 [Beijerinckiaceae bacterium]|nr:ribonuclease T2 [Beijerinckiaceae bacterium]